MTYPGFSKGGPRQEILQGAGRSKILSKRGAKLENVKIFHDFQKNLPKKMILPVREGLVPLRHPPWIRHCMEIMFGNATDVRKAQPKATSSSGFQ